MRLNFIGVGTGESISRGPGSQKVAKQERHGHTRDLGSQVMAP